MLFFFFFFFLGWVGGELLEHIPTENGCVRLVE
jgi:hypothetical protein